MFDEVHFHIETHELGHVSVGKAVFGPENGSDLEHLREIAHEGHLFVELGALCEKRVLETVPGKEVKCDPISFSYRYRKYSKSSLT